MSMMIPSLWAKFPGKFFNISTKDGDDKWRDHFFTKEEFPTIREKLREWSDRNIYFCPHGFNRRNRQKGDAVMPMCLWADLDHVDPRKINPKPTIAIESSPGRYVGLWLLKGKKHLDILEGESLNRRLTYHLGCDKGGWDITQVLRYPGTRNYKYNSQPRVRMLWDDGPEWTLGKLEQILPEDPHSTGVEEGELDPAEVFATYQKKLPRWVRRELTAHKISTRVDRSEMLWKLENECIEAGMDIDEAFAVIKRSVWNKFAGRRTEDQQLRNEIQKAVDQHFRQKPKGKDAVRLKSDEEIQEEDDPNTYGRFKMIPMADVKREKVDWLVYPYLARGEITIIEGDPGLGKSYMVQVMAGSIATKRPVPHPTKGTQETKGNVAYFDFENAMGSVTKPRLEDNGFKNMKNYYQFETPFSIDDDDALEEAYEILERVQPSIIVFDTLNTYIGRADTHKAAETVQAFNAFKEFARHFNCAVVVIRHLTKSGGSAINRGQGSIAFTGTARIVVVVGVDPADPETRVACMVKGNLTKSPPGLSFSIEERKKGRSEFIWGDWVDLSAQEVLDASAQSRKEGKIGDAAQDAMEFIEQHCLNKTINSEKLYRMGEKRGITKRYLLRAAHRMGVKMKGKGKLGSQDWTLKKKDIEPDTDQD